MLPFGWLLWLVVGLIAGGFAHTMIPGRLKLPGDVIAGSLGGLISGYLFNVIGSADPTNFRAWSITVALLGAIVVLAAVRMIIGLRHPAEGN